MTEIWYGGERMAAVVFPGVTLDEHGNLVFPDQSQNRPSMAMLPKEHGNET